MKRQG
jgi:hypothetical protein